MFINICLRTLLHIFELVHLLCEGNSLLESEAICQMRLCHLAHKFEKMPVEIVNNVHSVDVFGLEKQASKVVLLEMVAVVYI